MRDKQEKNNQIADPPLLYAINKGKAKSKAKKTKQNKTLALARKERAKSKHRKQKERRSGLCLLKCKMEYHNVAESIKRRQRI